MDNEYTRGKKEGMYRYVCVRHGIVFQKAAEKQIPPKNQENRDKHQTPAVGKTKLLLVCGIIAESLPKNGDAAYFVPLNRMSYAIVTNSCCVEEYIKEKVQP